MTRWAAAVLVSLAAVFPARGQSLPAFDVASVKANVLRLEPTRAPDDVRVVERIARPSAD